MTARSRLAPLVWCFGLATGLLGMDPVAAGEAEDRAAILERYAPTIVRVEAVLRAKLNMGGQGQEQETRIDLMGAVVSPRGLIMVWNSHISSARMTDVLQDMGRDQDFAVDIAPTGFKVLFPGRPEEHETFLAATDSAMDLAFLQLEIPPAEALPFVDFSRPGQIGPGDQVVAVHRLGRNFDHAPYLSSSRIGGELRKPRQAWILDGGLEAYGLPVFDLQGRPVGALTTVFSQAGGEGQLFGVNPMMSSLGGGAQSFSSLGTFVLPARRVAGLIRLAGERAADLLKERSEE